MHDSGHVDDRQRLRNFHRNSKRLLSRQGCLEPGSQMSLLEILHRDVAVPGRHAEVVKLGNCRIVDVVQHLELVDEAGELRVSAQGATAPVQHLDDDVLALLGAEGRMDRCVFAGSQASLEVVAKQLRQIVIARGVERLSRDQCPANRRRDLFTAEQAFRQIVESAGENRLHRTELAAVFGQQNDRRHIRIGRDFAQGPQGWIIGRAIDGKVASGEHDVERADALVVTDGPLENRFDRLHRCGRPASDDELKQPAGDLAVGLDDQDSGRVVVCRGHDPRHASRGTLRPQ